REAWTVCREGERHKLVIGREILLSQALNVFRVTVTRVLTELLSAKLWFAVPEDNSHSGLAKRGNGSVRVLRGILNVRPVENGRPAGVDGAKRREKVANMHIFGSIDGAESV